MNFLFVYYSCISWNFIEHRLWSLKSGWRTKYFVIDCAILFLSMKCNVKEGDPWFLESRNSIQVRFDLKRHFIMRAIKEGLKSSLDVSPVKYSRIVARRLRNVQFHILYSKAAGTFSRIRSYVTTSKHGPMPIQKYL